MPNMYRNALAHFKKVDPLLHKAAQSVDEVVLQPAEDFFVELCSSIVGQQLSTKAADTIWSRFIELFPNKKVTAEHIAKLDENAIRAVGTSWAKIRSLKDLAEHILTKKLDLSHLRDAEAHAVHEALVQVKGIGPWTAEMFMMFSLAMPDVFSPGDAGLRRAIRQIYNLKTDPTLAELEAISARWAPYRTYASRILWKTLDAQPTLRRSSTHAE